MICVIKNSKIFAIHSDNQVAEIRNKYSGLDIIHVADDTNVTLGGTDPRDSGATWKDARLLKGIVEIEDELLSHQADYVKQIGYGTTTGVANTYALTLDPAPAALVDGLCISVKINVANTGASTINVNATGAKSIVDSKGNAMTSGKLKLNSIYTMRYNGTNFILQGEGASGNATASDLLSGKTASVDAGDIVGTMPNRGAVTITPSTTNQAIAAGYHNGSGYVSGDADLIAGNIKSGINIFGITGTFAGIKSIQHATVLWDDWDKTKQITIDSIDPNNAVVMVYMRGTDPACGGSVVAQILNSTTVQLTKMDSTYIGNVYSTVIEFEKLKSKQTGSTTGQITGRAIAINTVEVTKSIVLTSQKSTEISTNSRYYRYYNSYGVLTASNQLTVYGETTSTIYWQVAEFE